MSAQRTVLVTGASSGIGEACALRLARAGWRVFAGVRRTGDAPPGTEELLVDVTNAEQIRAASERIDELHGLVNNAGVAIAGPLEFLPLAELRRQLEVNVIGQVAVTQAFLPHLRHTHGRLVLVGSIGGKSALPFLGAYAASKHALEAIADSARLEVSPWGIRVAIVEPATIATPIWKKGAQTAEAIAAQLPPEAAELYGARTAAFRRAAAAADKRAEPAELVAEAVEHALTAKRPKARYLVGKDSRRRARVERLPTRMRDALLARVLLRA
jgi:NAD(P)-dependent dehydrogenase (short-subunit alcohol dehydrogenase family)